jgi:hypothetical protein
MSGGGSNAPPNSILIPSMLVPPAPTASEMKSKVVHSAGYQLAAGDHDGCVDGVVWVAGGTSKRWNQGTNEESFNPVVTILIMLYCDMLSSDRRAAERVFTTDLNADTGSRG